MIYEYLVILTGQWYARKTEFLLNFHDITNGVRRAKDDGIADKSLFKLLYFVYFIGLKFHAAVMMDYSWENEERSGKELYQSGKTEELNFIETLTWKPKSKQTEIC